MDQSPVKKPQQHKVPIDEVETIAGASTEGTVTTAQIKRSAANITRDLSEDDKEDHEHKFNSVSAILDRALNKPCKTPGAYSQADGATRVVTENGFTYCIKALDDWRIIDPEDDMRTSMYCN